MRNNINRDVLLDELQQQIQHVSTSTISNYATIAKKASEIEDGVNKCYFNKLLKSFVFKHGSKPLTECLQIEMNDNSIKNVNNIHFQSGGTIKGIVQDYGDIKKEEYQYYVPSMNVVWENIEPAFVDILNDILKIEQRIEGIDYDQKTIIKNDVEVDGIINCEWLNEELMKYALKNHKHDEVYAKLSHSHEFKDVYHEIINEDGTKTIKCLEEVLKDYEESMMKVINEKANLNHEHQITDVYKLIENEDGTKTKKSMESLLNELKTLINEKANINHEHQITDIYKLISNSDGSTTKKSMESLLNELKTSINEKANVNHEHQITDVYKLITNSDGSTTKKSMESLLNELKTSIDKKANVNHEHLADDVIYQEEKGGGMIAEKITVKKKLDDLVSKTEKIDKNGNKFSVWDAIFGVGSTVVGTIIDGGLITAVATLQTEVSTLQGQIAAMATKDLTEDVIDIVGTAGDIANTGGSIWNGLKGLAQSFAKIKNAMKGFKEVTTITEIPLLDL